MKVVYKLVFCLIFFFLIFPLSKAQIGVGIWPAKTEIEAPPFKTSITEINFFNPSKRNISLEIDFYCRNCEENVSFLGERIGKIIYNFDVEVSPLSLELKPSSLNQSEKILVKTFNPLFIKSWFKFNFLGKEIAIPFLLPIFDEKGFDYRVVAEIQQEQLKIQITCDVVLKLKGINKFIFFLSGCVIALAVALFLKKHVENEFSTYEELS